MSGKERDIDNVSPLFPGRRHEPISLSPAPSATPDSIQDELDDVLRDQLEPDPGASFPPNLLVAPEPDDPNAILCPQCKKYTWRGTEKCIRCHFNLRAHFAELERQRLLEMERMRHERISYWTVRFQLGMLGCMLCAMYGPEVLRAPAAIGFVARLAAALVVGKFLLWRNSRRTSSEMEGIVFHPENVYRIKQVKE